MKCYAYYITFEEAVAAYYSMPRNSRIVLIGDKGFGNVYFELKYVEICIKYSLYLTFAVQYAKIKLCHLLYHIKNYIGCFVEHQINTCWGALYLDDIYSYHTFLFPFAWEDDSVNMLTVFRNENAENIWTVADTAIQSSNFSRAVFLGDMNPTKYNEFHFFNEAARNLIFPDESGLVHNFRVKSDIVSGTQYIITKGCNKYTLDISNILLHIFSTGIAIIEIKCRNRQHRNLKAVKEINEYGRRIAMPFWPGNSGFSKCADLLELKGPHINERDDFCSYRNEKVSFCYVSKVLRCLLNKNGSGRVFRAKYTDKENEIQIRTIVDEKMYDCCLIYDKTFADSLINSYETNDGSFDRESEAELAELLYVETDEGYHNKNIRTVKEKLYGCLYLDEFTTGNPKLTAISDQAYIKLIGKPDYDVEYFDKIYTKIIILGIAQRMSLAKFSTRINKWTDTLGSSGKKITMNKVNSVMRLQKQFVTFQNQYALSEVTVKSEGRFIYDSIREKLNIQAEYADITGQINSLYELVSTAQGNAFNKWGLALSLIAMELSVTGHLITADDVTHLSFLSYGGTLVLAIEGIIAAITIWLVTGVIFNRKGK